MSRTVDAISCDSFNNDVPFLKVEALNVKGTACCDPNAAKTGKLSTIEVVQN